MYDLDPERPDPERLVSPVIVLEGLTGPPSHPKGSVSVPSSGLSSVVVGHLLHVQSRSSARRVPLPRRNEIPPRL